MATQTIGEINECTFHWKIENISNCWLKKGNTIKSPSFIAEALENTKWSLLLYSMGNTNGCSVAFYLHREVDCSGPNNSKVSYQIAFLDKDGSNLTAKTKSKYCLWKGNYWGFHTFETREKVFVKNREVHLPNDTLTVQSTIWKEEEKPVRLQHLYARTIFKENKRSFSWRIDKFSILKQDVRNKFKDSLIDFELVLNKEQGFEKRLALNMNKFHDSIKYISFKASIVDSKGKKENCGSHEYFPHDLNKIELSTWLFTKRLVENKIQYLPIDVLSIDFEYVSSVNTSFYECSDSNTTFPQFANEVVERINQEYVEKEESLNTSLVSDLKFMYNEGICSDSEIRTSRQTFPVHKAILSARSPVFRSMYNNDMKEKNRGYVDITDLKDETVQSMLLYIYTGSLGNLQFESAFELYLASDKYQILPLKSSFSAFLKENLFQSKACDLLVLADLHQDEDMKGYVQDYILRQDKEFFCCQEWNDFMYSHVKLAADIMYKRIHQE